MGTGVEAGPRHMREEAVGICLKMAFEWWRTASYNAGVRSNTILCTEEHFACLNSHIKSKVYC